VQGTIAPYNIYYNADMLTTAGISDIRDDWTFDELVDYARRISKPQEGIFGYDPFTTTWQWVIRSFGGDILDPKDPSRCILDSPEAEAGFQWIVDLVWKHNITPNPDQRKQWAATRLTDKGRQAFANGFIGMAHTSGVTEFDDYVADTKRVKFKHGVAYTPKGKAQVMDTTATILVANSQTKIPDELWEWLKFRTSPEVLSILLEIGGAPAVNAPLSEQKFLPPMKARGLLHPERISKGLDISRFWAALPGPAGQALGAQLADVWANKLTVREYLRTTVPKVNDELKKWWADVK